MIAVGVARPNASGQVITTTVMASSIAVASDRPASSHASRVAAPPISATSTSQNAARSASRWPGALEFCASCTSFTIWARAVSAPTLAAPHPQRPVRVDGGADDWGAGTLGYRQAFPGYRRLVDVALALLHEAVHGDLVAGPH